MFGVAYGIIGNRDYELILRYAEDRNHFAEGVSADFAHALLFARERIAGLHHGLPFAELVGGACLLFVAESAFLPVFICVAFVCKRVLERRELHIRPGVTAGAGVCRISAGSAGGIGDDGGVFMRMAAAKLRDRFFLLVAAFGAGYTHDTLFL